MVRRTLFPAALLLGASVVAAADTPGLVTKASRFPAGETLSLLDKTIRGAGLAMFATIDHAAAAQQAGLQMAASTVLIFGNPKGGTPLMQNTLTVAIDLPLKILVWEDASGKVWVSYNAASYLAERHRLKGMDKQVQGLDGALNRLVSGVVE
jgi:YD repeat-containing protein